MLRKALPICLFLSATPALADGAGTVATLDLAARLYAHGIATDDAVAVVAAFGLAHAITLRKATGWLHNSVKADETDFPPDGSLIDSGAPPPDAPSRGQIPAPPLALLTDEAENAALLMAEGNDDLTEIAEIIATNTAGTRTATANLVDTVLAPRMVDRWEIPFPGQVRAEVGIFGDGATLGMLVADAAGNTVCLTHAATGPFSCAFTPEENSFYAVSVMNRSGIESRYMLVTN